MPYNTISEANAYFATRLNSDIWDNTTDARKLKALYTAMRSINTLHFRGAKLDATQELEFPRDYADVDYIEDESVVPYAIQLAECEIAYALLDGFDIEQEANTLNASGGIGSVRLASDCAFIPEHLANGIASVVAWRHLKPFLRDPNTITLDRVS